MEGDLDVNIDSDDSYDLPDIFPKSVENNDPPKAGEIVWAEFRNLHWPALVRKYIKKQRKCVVWYLDSPRQCFKLHRNQILNFKDPVISQKIRRAVSETDFKEMHDKILSRTLTFIRRRDEGCNDNPGEFFDTAIPYLSFKNFTTDYTDLKNHTLSNESMIFDEESSNDSADENITENKSDESHYSQLFSQFQAEPDADHLRDIEKSNAIVECICTGQVDKHLLAVQRGKIPSEYQKFYEDDSQASRKKLWDNNNAVEICGVIKDQDKLKEISNYLMDLFEKTVEGGKCVIFRYVAYVWLPESIEKAMSILDEQSNSVNSSYTSILKTDAPAQKKKRTSKQLLTKKTGKLSCAVPSVFNKETNVSQINKRDDKPIKKLEETITKRKKIKGNEPVVQGSISNETNVSEIKEISDLPTKKLLAESSLEENVVMEKKLKKSKIFVQGTRSSPRKKIT